MLKHVIGAEDCAIFPCVLLDDGEVWDDDDDPAQMLLAGMRKERPRWSADVITGDSRVSRDLPSIGISRIKSYPQVIYRLLSSVRVIRKHRSASMALAIPWVRLRSMP